MAFLYLFLEIWIYYPLFVIMTFRISLLLRYISLIVQTTAMLISFFFLSFFYISLFWNLENNVTFLFLFYLLAQYVFLCSPFRSLCSVDFFLIFLCCFFLICSFCSSLCPFCSVLFTLQFFPTLLFVLCSILSFSVYYFLISLIVFFSNLLSFLLSFPITLFCLLLSYVPVIFKLFPFSFCYFPSFQSLLSNTSLLSHLLLLLFYSNAFFLVRIN